MLDKMGIIGKCEECGKWVEDDDVGCEENGLCIACKDADDKKQMEHWKPLYEGEKQAGLLPRKE